MDSKYEGHTPVLKGSKWKIATEKIGNDYCHRIMGATINESTANHILIADAPLLAEQNAKMLAFIKQDCAECRAASGATKTVCAPCENGKLIAEIER